MCGVWVCLGDTACQVIDVATCCSNMHVNLCASGSVVKCMCTVPTKVRGLNPAGNPSIL